MAKKDRVCKEMYERVVKYLKDHNQKILSQKELRPLIREYVRLIDGWEEKLTIPIKIEMVIDVFWPESGMEISCQPNDPENLYSYKEIANKYIEKKTKTYNKLIINLAKKCKILTNKYKLDIKAYNKPTNLLDLLSGYCDP